MQKNIPAISIVIPMYNTEKYIGECLDSILAQTFDDYEVIVVDDCSTDKSCAIVERYQRKFHKGGGVDRLKLIRSEKNSGGYAGTPRNSGIKIARGEYLVFIDSDDAITKNALEELFKVAEHFQADVVHCGAFYRATAKDNLAKYKKLSAVIGAPNIIAVNMPLLLKADLAEKARGYGTGRFNATPWNYLYRRNFILKNQLSFPQLTHGEDEFFNFCVLCKAETFVLSPSIYYIYRVRADSLNRAPLTLEKHIHEWFGSALKAIELYDNFMNEFEIFRRNPELKQPVFEYFISNNVSHHILPVYPRVPIGILDIRIRRELAAVTDKTALTTFLFNRMNYLHMHFLQAQNLIQQQAAQINELKRQLASK